jgi:hypothetical protein
MDKRSEAQAAPMWICPRCGRRFTKTNQAHSCRVRSIEDHFRGKDPRLRRLFDALKVELERTGPLRIDAVESTIHLASDYHFGGFAVRRDYLRVGFLSDHAIRDTRITRAERIGPHRVSHHVNVRSLRDLDNQLLGWLARAQALQTGRGKRLDRKSCR